MCTGLEPHQSCFHDITAANNALESHASPPVLSEEHGRIRHAQRSARRVGSPIREALGGLDGPLKAIRDASPRALHHFTRFDQVDQLVRARESDPEPGFMARMMTLCSLPRSNPGQRKEYVRRNGPYTLVMTAGYPYKLPFGNLP